MKQRLLNLLVAIDQLLYVTLTLGAGDPDETLSGAAYRTEKDGKILGKIFRPIIDGIMFFDPNHCLNARLREMERRI